MTDTLRLPSQLDLLDSADVCVVGGGLAGVTAAINTAEAGCDTILIEERGALGWEVSHGLEIFLSPGTTRPKTLDRIVSELEMQNAARSNTLDPVACECLFDTLVKSAKVRVHFRAFAGSIDPANGLVRVTTKSGPLAVSGRVIIDATRHSRLARSSGSSFTSSAPNGPTHSQSFLLCSVDTPESREEVDMGGVHKTIISPTLWQREAHIQIFHTVAHPEQTESELRFAIARTIETLRLKKPGFSKASLSLSAHESFNMRVGKLNNNSHPETFIVAGPAVLGYKPSIEELVTLGERAATAAMRQESFQ